MGVYRYRNAPVLLRLINEATLYGWEARFWSLDQCHPSLAAYSAGVGAGSKFSLLNRLLREEDFNSFDWIIVSDDDFILEQGSLAVLLALAGKARLAIAQPAHSLTSFSNHPITLCNPSAIARLTTFVEIGPLFSVNREWYERIFPFPDNIGMGWGLDIAWSDLRTSGAHLGIVDWVALRHLQPAAEAYDSSPERTRLQEALKCRGFRSLADFQKTLDVWRVWQSGPPWLNGQSQPATRAASE